MTDTAYPPICCISECIEMESAICGVVSYLCPTKGMVANRCNSYEAVAGPRREALSEDGRKALAAFEAAVNVRAVPACRECDEEVASIEYRDFPQPSSIKRYPVTLPCGHSAGFTGEWPSA